MPIDVGVSLPSDRRAKLYAVIKRTLPDAIWEVCMVGNRILVAQDRAEDMYKGVLHKPQRVVEKEQTEQASGWVIAAGPDAGDGSAPHPRGIKCNDPQELLGLHIYYQMWAGKVFRTDEGDQEFGGTHALIVLTDRDVQGFDDKV